MSIQSSVKSCSVKSSAPPLNILILKSDNEFLFKTKFAYINKKYDNETYLKTKNESVFEAERKQWLIVLKFRWGNTPLTEAERFGHSKVVSYLKGEFSKRRRSLNISSNRDSTTTPKISLASNPPQNAK